MEKKTWNEDKGGFWDYSNKQKKQLLAEQNKIEAKEAKRKQNGQKKIAAVTVKPFEVNSDLREKPDFEESAVMVEIPVFEMEAGSKSWWLWWL